ncbi:MAG: peptidoglycan-binding protein [Clostridia bacterium]|nr:peptidoglycan-binding protein [Clostridia bacterium]
MGRGTVRFQVHTARDALPVADAQIDVYTPDSRHLYHLQTDGSGNTDAVFLDAPDKDTTMYPGGEAYSKYNITVKRNGYIAQKINGVEILDTIDSTQPIELHPEYTGAPLEETIDIPDNALKQDYYDNGRSPHDAPRQRVLHQVFIPQYITVHLGAPASNAQNVYVPFKEYIKNVAASEIYATWPVASLEANILAQISLALNRVYTEWYRVQGRNFDITNSTQFDQYYKPGQTIPNNISVIVERIFNRFIRRTGHREPLFASYCNGTTATCSGMSQWGTVSLANNGYSYLQILRRYYGNEIIIDQTNNIQGVTPSWPGYTLTPGATGSNVTRMQTYLNRISTNYPLIPKINPPNGVYGASTTAAVRVFQQVFNLPVTGNINQETWNKISFIYLAVTKLAELGSEGQRIGIGTTPPTEIIRRGSRGARVIQLQFLLNAIGMFYNTIPPVLEDAFFEANTENAVRAFQRQFGLNPDGIVGPATWRKLYEVYHGLDFGPGGTGDLPAYPGVPLRVGSYGPFVEFIQTCLNFLSTKYPGIPRVAVDGLYGTATAMQVMAFQKEFGLLPDGVIGPATWDAIMSAYSAAGGPVVPQPPPIEPPILPPPPPPIIPAYPRTPLRPGSSGNNVRVLQEALNRLSIKFPAIPKLTPDGAFGPITRSAVVAAQRALGLVTDGIVGPITWNAVMNAAAQG